MSEEAITARMNRLERELFELQGMLRTYFDIHEAQHRTLDARIEQRMSPEFEQEIRKGKR